MNKLKIAVLLLGIISGLRCDFLVGAANNYKTISISDKSVKVGNTIFSASHSENPGYLIYAEKNGVKKLICSGDVGFTIITNGEEVFYKVSSIGGYKNTVYRKQIDSGISNMLFSVDSYSFDLWGYWNNKLYYVKELDPGQFCSYELDTGDINVLMDNVTEAHQYGRYFITNPYAGAPAIGSLGLYDANKDKIKTISKKCFAHNIISNRIYYVNISKTEIKKFYKRKPYRINVYRCNLDGSKKKKMLSRKINGDISKIGKKCIKYWDKKGKVHTVKYRG
ncbi:MAG: hypothetical protein IJ232_09860 [Lachnospiraceae bacterium]|nr:hypothetical protein [Lachnospiraceae bacterium]